MKTLLEGFNNFLNEANEGEVLTLPGDSVYEYKRENDKWHTRRQGSQSWSALDSSAALDDAFPELAGEIQQGRSEDEVTLTPNITIARQRLNSIIDNYTDETKIKRGSSGDAVTYVQAQVDAELTGVYDDQTVAAVRVFQRERQLNSIGSNQGDVAGIVGPKTAAALLGVEQDNIATIGAESEANGINIPDRESSASGETLAQGISDNEVVQFPGETEYEYKRSGGIWSTRKTDSGGAWISLAAVRYADTVQRLNDEFSSEEAAEVEPNDSQADLLSLTPNESTETGLTNVILRSIRTVGETIHKAAYNIARFFPSSGLLANNIPVWIAFFIYFISLRKREIILTSDDHKRAMYYICKNAENRGSTGGFSYRDYFEAQKLDPSAEAQEATYANGDWSKTSLNPYVCLSAAVGRGSFTKQGDVYSYSDNYDFNILRGGGEKIEDYMLNSKNFSNGVSRAIDLLGNDRMFAGVEELCVWYEITLGYRGFPVSGTGEI